MLEQSRAEIAANGRLMAEFMQTPYWRLLKRYLQAGVESRFQQLLVPTAPATEFLRGEARAFQEILALPEWMREQGETIAGRE